MNKADYDAMRDAHLATALGINDMKGADYAGTADVLSNFKRHAAALGLTPEQVWAVYASKHWDAVMSFCREGDVKSEPIEGRIHDIIVYSCLLLGLIEDRAQEPEDPAPAPGAPLCECRERFGSFMLGCTNCGH